MKNFLKVTMVAVLSAMSVGAMAQTIDNASFASGLTTSDVNDNWTDYNNSALSVSTAGGVATLGFDALRNQSAIMYQSLDGLTAGHTYQISFFAAGSGFLDMSDERTTGSPAFFDLTNGSVGLGETDAAFVGWSSWMTSSRVFRINTGVEALQQYSFTFTADDSTEYLWVKGFTGAGGLSSNLRVDNFAINDMTSPVPEPETYAMMLAGLGAMGLMARRRRAK